VRGALQQAADDQRQDGLVDLVVGDAGQVGADLPDVRVLGPVHGEVGGGPRGLILGQLLLVHGQVGRFQRRPDQGELAQGPEDAGGLGALEPGLEHGADEDIDGPDLRGTLRGAVRGQGGGRRVRTVDGALPPDDVDDRVDPAGVRLQAGHALLDQPIRDREDQVVLARKMAVDRGGIRAQRAAELGQAEPADSVLVEQPEALCHDSLRGQAPAPETGPPDRRLAAASGFGHLPTPLWWAWPKTSRRASLRSSNPMS